MISTGQIIVILVVVLLLFGTKRLRNIGSDLGAAIKGFKKSMSDGEQDAQQQQQNQQQQNPPQVTQQQQGGRVIDNDAAKTKQDNGKS
ncbi:MAG: twin-arginine translocase TatA/TatE family subunit [Pseudomonadota bacterium]